ncbi:hypothetical protein JXR93_02465 [bacterium]|nr:hypothetical protein [bacterium]
MDIQDLYALGKKFYDANKHEDKLEEHYIKIDDLLDALDALRMELKLLLEEDEKNSSMTAEDKLHELYKELAEISKDIDNFDISSIEKIEREMETFKSKNKYKFMQIEEAEKKYAAAVEKKLPDKQLQPYLENLKKMRLDSLHIQKELERYQQKIANSRQDLIKLEAKKEATLKKISEYQKNIHKKTTAVNENASKNKEIILKKKTELDQLKNEIKKSFVIIGKEALKNNLK